MIPYIITSCGYMQYHAGIRALYKLADKLNAAGCEAYMFSAGNAPYASPNIYSDRRKLQALIKAGAIVVYPEIYPTNVLGSKRPVSWMLNYRETDISERFYWHRIMTATEEDERVLALDLVEHDLFNNNAKHERLFNSVWVGKGMADDRMYTIPDARFIANTRPADRAELAVWLKQSKALYTFDAMTMLVSEACLCGTPVIYLPNAGNTQAAVGSTLDISVNGFAYGNEPAEIERAEASVGAYAADYAAYFGRESEYLADFIRLTQRMEAI